MYARWLGLGLAVLVAGASVSCGGEEVGDPVRGIERGEAVHGGAAGPRWTESTKAALRAATIASVQRHAPEVFWTVPAQGEGARSPGALAADTPDAARWIARNEPHGFVAAFSQRGVTVTTGELEAQRASFEVAGFGCEGAANRVIPALAEGPTAQRGRVEVRHPGAFLEWYANGPFGLEQGFTFEQAPCGRPAWLTVDLELTGDLGPIQVDAGRIELRDTASATRLHVSELFAYDALGTVLPAHFALHERTLSIRVDATAANYPVVIDPLIATQQSKLIAGDATIQDGFGTRVAIDGDTALVSAVLADAPTAKSAGAVYVLAKSGDTWLEEAKLTASDGASVDLFGSSIALSGDTAIVGARHASPGGVDEAGAAYVFVRSGGVWTEEAKLAASDGSESDQFGGAVALDGDMAIAGAYKAAVAGNVQAGAAYVFARGGGVWTEQQKLTASNLAASESFGKSMALEDATLIIGQESAGKGVADVFVRSGDSWVAQAQLGASDGTPMDRFGFSVALSGETALIGAFRADPGGQVDAGAAYVFARTGDMWSEEAKLTASNGAANDSFGWAVALDGDVALVGATSGGLGAVNDAGAVYAFERDGDLWVPAAEFTPGDVKAGDGFGGDVAIEGETALIGAAGHDLPAKANAGAAYVFSLVKAPPQPDGGPCASNGACASGFCADGVCCGTACDAGPCDACSIVAGAAVDGVCEPFTGLACDDGNPCTRTDVCEGGFCVGSDEIECMGSDSCHLAGTCDPASGGCTNPPAPDGMECDDNNACTNADSCQNGVCVSAAIGCPASDDCHEVGTCDPATGVCSNPVTFDGAVCEVGTCKSGVCVPAESGSGGSGGGEGPGAGGGNGPDVRTGPCNCDVPGSERGRGMGALASALALAIAGLRRRRGSRLRG